jgi:EAL domain-containing protein (putative c-di-GMP-specific phosphodiesterase class I)
VAVNISVRQLQAKNFVASVKQALNECCVDPSCIELEVTESAAMHDADRVIRTLDSLRALGLSIAMDDFGTGYSSLSYLRQFPLQTVKLDRSFIEAMSLTDTDESDVVEAVISLAHRMGLKVVAEGVETFAQLERLKALGCDELQGYLYGRPMPVAAATAFIGQSSSASIPEPEEPLHVLALDRPRRG